jgi:hypothetical protein
MDGATALKQVILIAADLYKSDFSELTIRTWALVLAPFEPKAIEAALMAHMRDPERGRFAPRPADLIGQIERSQAAGVDLAQLAIQRAIRTVSARTGVAFDDPVTHVAMQSIGGWPRAYAELSSPETAGDYVILFAKAYAKARENKAPHPAFLPGVGNQSSYTYVGDQTRVDRVVSSGYNPVSKLIAIGE